MINLFVLLKTIFSGKQWLSHEVETGLASKRESYLVSRLFDVLESFSAMLRYLSVRGLVMSSLLLLIVLMSAMGVVYSSHLSRQLFAEQAVLLERNDQMQLEWAQLLLEQSAWSSPNRIESVASDQLKMKAPNATDIQLIY